ncbi:hypothetical protein [Nocardioides sp.]|uniref:hypothetical protein n=1 Tax=Nocardioides sp. TaxID=35761 RepID=UPI002ED11F12
MSITSAADVRSSGVPGHAGHAGPRVRHLAREAIVLMAFSAGASTAIATCLLLLTVLGRRG